jgi:hypothetical protein
MKVVRRLANYASISYRLGKTVSSNTFNNTSISQRPTKTTIFRWFPRSSEITWIILLRSQTGVSSESFEQSLIISRNTDISNT